MSWSRLAVRLSPLLGLALCLALALGAATVSAQEATPRFKSVKVSIWPEYDAPRVLVFYEAYAGGQRRPAGHRALYPAAGGGGLFGLRYRRERPAHRRHVAAAGRREPVRFLRHQQARHPHRFLFPAHRRRRQAATSLTPCARRGRPTCCRWKCRSRCAPATSPCSPRPPPAAPTRRASPTSATTTPTSPRGLSSPTRSPTRSPTPSPRCSRRRRASTPASARQYAVPLVLLGLGATALGTYFYARGRRPAARPQPPSNGRKGKRAAAPPARAATAARPAPKVAQAYCTQCGAEVRAGAAFCTACGQPLRRSTGVAGGRCQSPAAWAYVALVGRVWDNPARRSFC